MASGRLKRSEELFKKFVETLEKQDGNVSLTCKILDISKTAAYEWKSNDADFSTAWNDAVERTLELMEQEAYRRAVRGYMKPVYYQGAEVGQVMEYSDRLLELLLTHKRGFKTRTENLYGGIPGAPPIKFEFYPENLTFDESMQLATLLDKAQIKPDAVPK